MARLKFKAQPPNTGERSTGAPEYLSFGQIKYHGIFKHLLLNFLLIGTLPVIVICIVLFSSVQNEISNSVRLAQNQVKNQYLNNLEYRLAGYKESLFRIAKNTLIQRLLSESEASRLNPITDGALISEEVNKTLYIGEYSDIVNCVVYSKNDKHELYGKNVTMLKLQPRLERSALLQNELTKSFEEQPWGKNLLKLYYPIANARVGWPNVAWIELDLAVDSLFSPVVDKKFTAHNFSVLVLNRQSERVFDSGAETPLWPALLKPLHERLQNEGVVQEGRWVFSMDELETEELSVIFAFENQELIHKQQTFLSLLISIIVLLLAAVLLISFFITRSFSSRVRQIAKKMDEAGRGNFVLDQPVSGRDEIKYLDEQLNLMFMRLDELMVEIIEKDTQKREAQIESLQFQINPHFLYNTLETISSMASIQHADEICDICHKLGDIFRYSLGKDYDKLVSLEQELSFVRNYFAIQKLRFGRQLDAFYDIDAEYGQTLVPRFILQPIIENAISHGLKPKNGKGVIEISARRISEAVFEIKIEDDGVGMQDRQIAWLNRSLALDQVYGGDERGGIGVCNVHHRIRLMYGPSFGIHFASQAGAGTQFYIRIPWLTREDAANQAAQEDTEPC